MLYLRPRNTNAVVAQLVEHQLPKLRVAGSSPVYRSMKVATGYFYCIPGRELSDP